MNPSSLSQCGCQGRIGKKYKMNAIHQKMGKDAKIGKGHILNFKYLFSDLINPTL